MYKDLFQKAKQNQLENFQICETTIENLNIETYNDKLDKFETSNITSYLISAIYQEKAVRLTTEYLDDTIINALKEQAEYLDIETPPTRKNLENIKETKTYQINTPDKIIKKLENLIHFQEQYPSLKEINAQYSETIIQRKIRTSQNELYDIKKETSCSIEVMVSEDNKNSTSYDTKITLEDSNIDIETLAQEVIQNALDKLHYQEIASGTYQVILTSRVMGNILNQFIHLFSADSLQKDTSLLVGKQGKQVFSNKITIVEDPTNSKLPGKRLFDDTGTLTCQKEIIKAGIFHQPLYDDRTATIDKTKTTGNDYGEISVRNMYLLPGTKSLNEIITSLEKGILIDSVTGLHAGINPINGDISVQSEGYYIEHGKKQYATKLFVLSTNIMDILNNVQELSNHTDFYHSTTASPDILVDNIKLSK